MLYLPEPYHASIGLVVAYWGNFEVLFDQILGALLQAEQNAGGQLQPGKWKHLSFNKRRQLFDRFCKESLNARKPEIASKFLGLLARAADLQWKRNMIAHGTYRYSILPMSSAVSDCYAYNERDDRKLPFDDEILKKLYHDISHLTADFVREFGSLGKIEGYPFILVKDDEIIKIYRNTVHPWNPDPRLRPQPPPS